MPAIPMKGANFGVNSESAILQPALALDLDVRSFAVVWSAPWGRLKNGGMASLIHFLRLPMKACGEACLRCADDARRTNDQSATNQLQRARIGTYLMSCDLLTNLSGFQLLHANLMLSR